MGGGENESSLAVFFYPNTPLRGDIEWVVQSEFGVVFGIRARGLCMGECVLQSGLDGGLGLLESLVWIGGGPLATFLVLDCAVDSGLLTSRDAQVPALGL